MNESPRSTRIEPEANAAFWLKQSERTCSHCAFHAIVQGDFPNSLKRKGAWPKTPLPRPIRLKEVIFPQGIPGFEDQTRFRLHYSDTESGRVYWMESCVCPEITFTLVDPELYALNYVLELTDEEETLLQG